MGLVKGRDNFSEEGFVDRGPGADSSEFRHESGEGVWTVNRHSRMVPHRCWRCRRWTASDAVVMVGAHGGQGSVPILVEDALVIAALSCASPLEQHLCAPDREIFILLATSSYVSP